MYIIQDWQKLKEIALPNQLNQSILAHLLIHISEQKLHSQVGKTL
ncbi:MAG: hypothetical protein Q4A81_04585 [Pasteurellaceae bacterium]|nr:hypothetical protein [Pasteurellaceae bacterium]